MKIIRPFKFEVIIATADGNAKAAREWCMDNVGKRGVDWHACLEYDGKTQKFLIDSEAKAVELKLKFG